MMVEFNLARQVLGVKHNLISLPKVVEYKKKLTHIKTLNGETYLNRLGETRNHLRCRLYTEWMVSVIPSNIRSLHV